LLSVELFSCLAEARRLIEDWRHECNHHRPRSSLAMTTPHGFAVGYRAAGYRLSRLEFGPTRPAR